MKNFLRIAGGLDVTPLLLAVTRRDIWKEDTFLRNYPQGPFGDVESIILRFPNRELVEAGGDEHENYDRDVYKDFPEARHIVMALMARVGGERLGRVILNKIRPGGRISPHADSPNHAEYWDRFHVVLQSASGVVFRAEEEQVFMAPGETWWFQNAVEHEVINNSPIERIHLVIDIRTSK
jgi:hypothetical protein